MKNLILTYCFGFFASLLNHSYFAQQSILSINVPQTQNFDGMGTTATASLPTGFRGNIGNGNWSDGLNETTLAYGTTGTGAITGTSSGGFINFANGITSSSTDRSLGYLNTGTYTSPRDIFYAFTNNTGSTVTSIDLAWDYEKYRSGTRAFDWTFFHGSTGNAITTAATSGDQSYAADANNTTIFNPPTSISKSFSITGLNIPDGTTYYLRWRFTGVGGSTNGQAIGIDNFSITLQAATLCAAPATQAYNITFSSVSDGSMNLSWTNGSGDGRVVIMNTTNSFTAPTSGSNPTANTVYSGAGEQVVFNGTGSGPVTVSNLNPSTTYWFRVYEFCNPNRVYQTSTASNNPDNFTTAACASLNHFFRSVASGNWNSTNTWESSFDGIVWATPNCAPDFNASTIHIRNGHTVTLNTALDVDQIIIENGGILRKESGATMTLRDGAGDDILVENGGVLEYAGALSPTYQNANVRIRVQTGGRIRVSTATTGISNNLAGNSSSGRVIYEHESVFQYNSSNIFATSNQVYFPDVNATTIPIFQLTANIGSIGAETPTTFNGVLEANANITFTNSGDKTFRNGIIGTGNVSQTSTCGRFLFTGPTAFLGGTGVINLDFNRITVIPGVEVVMISNKTINTTNTDPFFSELRVSNNAILNMGPYTLNGTAHFQLRSTATLSTAHPNGLDGALNLDPTKINIETPQNQTLIFNRAGAQNTGSTNLPAACGNLITGSGTILTLQDDLEVNNVLTIGANSIIHVDLAHELYVSNSDVNAIVGGVQSGLTNFITGPLRWATDNGSYNFPIGFAGYGAQGFTIDVTDAGDVLGFLETNNTLPLQGFAYCDLETSTAPGQQIGEGAPGADGILDQIEFNLASALQWNITNPGGGVSLYNLTVNASGTNDILPVIAADGTPIRYLLKNGEPGNTGVTTGNAAPEFTQTGFIACPNAYTLSGMTGFSTFTINGATPSNTALPIELLFFTAKVNHQNSVALNWATASEFNNDFFTIERSQDGSSWEIVETLNGNGTTPVRNDYSTFDQRPHAGLSYYRLKQTDFDGSFEYSNIVSIFVNEEEKSLIKVVNLLGQTVNINTRGMVILVFSNGETLKMVNE